MADASRFTPYPSEPKHSSCSRAFEILTGAHRSASSFAHIFQERAEASAPSDEDQDLLRAMLLFASAGMDSMVKQLARDCLSLVIELNEGAREQFRVFLERRLRDEEMRFSTLSRFMVGSDPVALRQLLVDDITAQSLQSVEQLSRAGSYFDIATPDLMPDVERLKEVFAMRNQIAHEMDVSADSAARRQRDFPSMSNATNEVFAVSDRFLSLVDSRLPTI